MSKIIKAKFTGQNFSCGFITNGTYELSITTTKKGNIAIESLNGNYCEYGSLIAFLNNWTNIAVQ